MNHLSQLGLEATEMINIIIIKQILLLVLIFFSYKEYHSLYPKKSAHVSVFVGDLALYSPE